MTPISRPLTRPTSADQPRQARIANQSLPFEPAPTPTTRLPTSVTTPGIERSIPPAITTSISPSAATARKVASGSTALNELPDSVSGAAISATTKSTPVASQTGTNPDPTSTLRGSHG